MKTNVRGLEERNGSWRLRRMIKRVSIDRVIGRTDEVTKKEAEKFAVELINLVRLNGSSAIRNFKTIKWQIGNNSPTVGDIATEVLERGMQHGTRKTKHKRWKENTIREWKTAWSQPRMGTIKAIPIKELSGDDVKEFYRTSLEKEGLPSATENSFRKILRVCNFAIGEEHIKSNPCHVVSKAELELRVSGKKRTGRLKIDSGEVGKYLVALIRFQSKQKKETTRTIRDLLILSLLYGRRKEELCQMEWKWIDLDNGTILIPAESVEGGFQGTKNRQPMHLPLTKISTTLLRHRHEDRKRLSEKWGNKASDKWVFLGAQGTSNPKPIRNFRTTMNLIMEQANLDKNIIHHDFRRTYSDLLKRTDATHAEQTHLMGHTLDDMTSEYQEEMPMYKKKEYLQKVSDMCSRLMPIEINGELLSGEWREYEGESSQVSGFVPDALEHMLFSKVWRNGKWEKSKDLDELIAPTDP